MIFRLLPFRCLLLGLPSVLWPLGEWFLRPGKNSIFLPFLDQIDVAYPLSWIMRMSADPAITDLAVWEHRYDPGSPSRLVSFWPIFLGWLISFGHTPAAYWGLVYAFHVLWIWIAWKLVESFAQGLSGGLRWILVALFIYGALPFSLNAFVNGWRLWKWSPILIYENFRVYPSVIALMVATLAVWRLHVSNESKKTRDFLVAGLCVSMTLYGRPFDWMILVTFIGLMGLRSLITGNWKGWGVCFATTLVGASPFMVRYAFWAKGDRSSYLEGLARGVMQGKDLSHFIKYGFMAAVITGMAWAWMRWLRRFSYAKSKIWDPENGAFLVILVLASFLPYFQCLPGGKTISSYQYYFTYFTMPFVFLAFVLGMGVIAHHGLERKSLKSPGFAFAPAIGVGCQLLLLMSPSWMVDRVAFHRESQSIYDRLSQCNGAVVLSPAITGGSSQELILRSGAWSFVPHPMMYCFPSMASTAELLERQLLAKLLLTGAVSDLAPLFSEKGLPGYDSFYRNASPETVHWLDRLENCPARSFFVFDPVKSRADFRARQLKVPESLLKQPALFAYFNPKDQEVFRKVQSLEKLNSEGVLNYILSHFRLTHLLLPSSDESGRKRLEECSQKFTLLERASDGTTLWEIK